MIIYRATNQLNGKCYVGASRNALAVRRAQHKRNALGGKVDTHFYAAIRKHGWDAFEWEVLEVVFFIEDLALAEQRWIASLKCQSHQGGYNGTAGGGALTLDYYSLSRREKLSRALTGKKMSPERRAAMSQARKGRRLGQETIQKIVAANTGKKRSPEHCAHMSRVLSGKTRSDQAKAAISAGMRSGDFGSRFSGVRRNNSSGVSGVSWDRRIERWAAYINPNRRKRHLGHFDDFFEAVCARKSAELNILAEAAIG